MSKADMSMMFNESLDVESAKLTMVLDLSELPRLAWKCLIAICKRQNLKWTYTFNDLTLNDERLL